MSHDLRRRTDTISDEVARSRTLDRNQLYFDRQRTLLALSAYADRSDPEDLRQ
jgi:hypothetical protein